MKQITLIFILLTGFISSVAQNRQNDKAPDSNGLVFTVRADRERYALGENITVTLTWENTSKKKLKISTSPMMGHVRVFNDDTKQEVRYRGVWGCGTGGTQSIAARDKFRLEKVLNHFLSPSFDLTNPGRYSVSLDYGSCCSDQPGPTATFEIIRLDEEALKREREKAFAGDKTALQILAAHGDESVVSLLGELSKSSDEKTRLTVYRALLILNTEDSMRILGEAATANLPVTEKLSLLMSLHEMEPVPNPSLIFYIRILLDDPYVGGYSTTQIIGQPAKRYKLYSFRRMASLILKRFNIEAQVVEEEEMKAETGSQ